MKKRFTTKFNSKTYRMNLTTQLRRKYYNMWMGAYKFNGVGYQENNWIMRKLWELGHIASFKLLSGELCFTPYAPQEFNIYDFPIKVNLINTRGVSFIPAQAMKVDEDAVIGWALPDMNPLREIVEQKVEEIVTAKMTIRLNLLSHKMPYFIAVAPEDLERMKALVENLLDDDPVIYGDIDDINSLKAFVTGAPYIIDKLQMHIETLESELMTQFGFDNVAFEKKERMTQDETNANNVEINASADTFKECLDAFCERCNTILKPITPISCESTHEKAMAEMLKTFETEKDGDEDEHEN